MSLVLSPLYLSGDKVLFLTETSGKTYFLLVKINDVFKAEILDKTKLTYEISYDVSVYDDIIYNAAISLVPPVTPVYKTMVVSESKLISLTNFNTNYITYI